MIDPTRTLGSLPPEQAAELERAGPIWGTDINRFRDLVVKFYSPLVAAAPKDGIAVARDLPYGDSARQVLDIFTPDGARDADVVVFVHGGAFIRGSKSSNGHIYDNVSYWFARQGMVAINMEYRLAGEAPFPGGADDVAAAVRWLAEHVSAYGGNPRRMFLIGHSAGGTHVATYCFDPRRGYRPDPGVLGAVLVSARLRADTLPGNPNARAVEAYFGTDPARHESDSPMTYAAESDLPVMIAIAQYENPYLDLYGLEFCQRVARARGHVPRFVQMMRHNHTSIVAHFDSGEETLGREILDFFRGVA